MGRAQKGSRLTLLTPSRLVNSVIRGNSFLYDLREGIDASIVSTRIEQNQFGKNEEVGCAGRRHMRIRLAVDDSSLLIDQDQANFLTGNESWIAYNVFHGSIAQVFTARELTLDESLLVTQPSAVRPPFRDRAPRLNLVGNDFEGNFSDTAVRIRGVVRVIVDGNWFERTCGSTHIKLSSESRNRALIASLENNRYGMSGCEGGAPNSFVVVTDPATDTWVTMGYELVQELTRDARLINTRSALQIIGPLCLRDYQGAQDGNVCP